MKKWLFALALVACEPFSPRPEDAVPLAPTDTAPQVTGVPANVRSRLNLAPFYERYSAVRGFPIVSSRSAQNVALLECGWIIDHVLERRPDILTVLRDAGIRVVVIAPTEVPTDLPESANLWPRAWVNGRFRGRAPRTGSPLITVGEENVLGYRGDPSSGSQMVHELGHAIHSISLSKLDPTFDARLRAAYDNALSARLWQGTYTAHNHSEYWATGVEGWFDAADNNPTAQGGVNTREELRAYDPGLSALLAEVFGDDAWRLPGIALRRGQEHLAGFDAGAFAFRPSPTMDVASDPSIPELILEAPTELRAASPAPGSVVVAPILFANQTDRTISVDYVDPIGQRSHRFQLRSGEVEQDETSDGLIWAIKEESGALKNIVVGRGFSKVVVR